MSIPLQIHRFEAFRQASDDLTDPREVLAAALDRYERLAIATSLGPQTLVLIDMLHQMGREVPVFFLDTGVLFPETYALRLRVQARYGLHIQPITGAGAEDHLWETDPDRCCHVRKVEPLKQVLSGLDAWITGLRRDQSASRANTRSFEYDALNGLQKVNPLAWWSRDQVFAYLREHDVPFNPLLNQGYASVGCRPCTRPCAAADERGGRWAGRRKTECGIHFSPSSNSSKEA